MTIALNVDWDKVAGLVPAIVQDADGGAVLMLGYMNRDALGATLESRRVTFWSRSRQCLWTKGEGSGHFLRLRSIAVDCDGDSLLVLAAPDGPTCHTGTSTCWGAEPPRAAIGRLAFLGQLERIIAERMSAPPQRSYTARLLAEGMSRIAQKVGEEAVELALAAVVQADEKVVGEAADLLYHMILLLRARNLSLAEVVAELESRHPQRAAGTSPAPDAQVQDGRHGKPSSIE
ncbi:MAG: bifunctional phosphoribosyl-AMP cyclohydrolase/phosphoribosyl-ATP diphosphatase HisIE [Steroidobacteraceae bacterium]